MSGASGLAAAKRRRGPSGGPSGGPGAYGNVNTGLENNQPSVTFEENQPVTPMGILTQYHIRLR